MHPPPSTALSQRLRVTRGCAQASTQFGRQSVVNLVRRALVSSVIFATACAPGGEVASSPSSTESQPQTQLEQTTTTVETERSEPAPLEDRVLAFHSRSAKTFDIEEWLPLSCRQSLGLVSDTDPLINYLTGDAITPKQSEVQTSEFVEISPGVFAVERLDKNGTPVIPEVWVLEDGLWKMDVCNLFQPGFGAGTTLTGTATRVGLRDRIESIDRATSAGETGNYQWLSQRCRQDIAAELGDYLLVYLQPLDLDLDFGDTEIVELNGHDAAVTPITTSSLMASGRPTDRWAYEFGNWFYDGCPTQQDTQDANEKQLERLATAHASIPGLEIEGLIATGSFDTDINGPLERVFTYESLTDKMAWWTAQELYMEKLFPEALEAEGYEINIARGQTVSALLPGDPMATVDIRLESTGGDRGLHLFYVTIRYR